MKKVIEKAAVLIEALPYIQSFRGKVVLVKFGGSAMANGPAVDSILKDVVFMHTVGMKPVLVHGGGKRISAAMKKQGIRPKFVNGYRVTTAEAIHLVKETLMGEVNAELVARVKELGTVAEGIAGDDSAMIHVDQFRPLVSAGGNSEPEPADIGFVGEVKSINTDPIYSILESDSMPIIATLGLGDDGKTYNVNADEVAGEIAVAMKAEKLVFLSNIKGVMKNPDDESSLISSLKLSMVENLMKKNIIKGGMIPKIRACIKAVNSGVHKTHIIDGRLQHSLLLEIFTDKGIGTQIVK